MGVNEAAVLKESSNFAWKTDCAMARKNITKKIRFEVFKRDGFRCQYCGRSAPNVVLNADHIDPVANGGETSPDNLLTACVDCNSGKSDRLLAPAIVAEKLHRPWLVDFHKVLGILRWKENGYVAKKDQLIIRKRIEQAVGEGVSCTDIVAIANECLSAKNFLCGLMCLVFDARVSRGEHPMFVPV